MGPTWGRHDLGGPHVGHMKIVVWVVIANLRLLVIMGIVPNRYVCYNRTSIFQNGYIKFLNTTTAQLIPKTFQMTYVTLITRR